MSTGCFRWNNAAEDWEESLLMQRQSWLPRCPTFGLLLFTFDVKVYWGDLEGRTKWHFIFSSLNLFPWHGSNFILLKRPSFLSLNGSELLSGCTLCCGWDSFFCKNDGLLCDTPSSTSRLPDHWPLTCGNGFPQKDVHWEKTHYRLCLCLSLSSHHLSPPTDCKRKTLDRTHTPRMHWSSVVLGISFCLHLNSNLFLFYYATVKIKSCHFGCFEKNLCLI